MWSGGSRSSDLGLSVGANEGLRVKGSECRVSRVHQNIGTRKFGMRGPV